MNFSYCYIHDYKRDKDVKLDLGRDVNEFAWKETRLNVETNFNTISV